MENLVILDVSNNILKTLPQTLGNLIKLKQLSIRGNPNVQHLPKSICNAQRLVTLDVDVENLLYPPRHVAEEGIASIMSYICNGKCRQSRQFVNVTLSCLFLRYWLLLHAARKCRRDRRSRQRLNSVRERSFSRES